MGGEGGVGFRSVVKTKATTVSNIYEVTLKLPAAALKFNVQFLLTFL